MSARVALVTGGTNGIGQGIARVLLSEGYSVMVTGLTDEELAQASKELSGDVDALLLDVRNPQSCEDAVKATIDRFGKLYVFLSNAEVYPQAKLEATTDDDIDLMFQINLYGTIRMVQAAQEALKEAEHGRIILTSSITGPITGYPGWSHYEASKAAQLGFMRSAAMEFTPHTITVNAVQPGNVTTPGLKALGEEYLKEMASAVPLGYLGEPEDIGAAVAFLASPGARYVTGHAIVVDGGQIMPESPDALKEM
ncbi:3-oxoacyl-ACP reductase FabG [Flaviflexus massiliensis]|uniref:3-oxoacyl-ACP reductase FabG n=1 Tax=Flaviflexus massiliensis TaxID=1522309 RepID=UPI000B0F36CA|nr:3-oxoacyl-ACP reductase FabG [Flaviflexus massiliensis]